MCLYVRARSPYDFRNITKVVIQLHVPGKRNSNPTRKVELKVLVGKIEYSQAGENRKHYAPTDLDQTGGSEANIDSEFQSGST